MGELANKNCNRQITILNKKIKIDFLYIGMLLLTITAIFNTSKYGASLSWVLIPCILIIIGGFLNRVKIKTKQIWLFLFYCSCLFSTLISDDVTLERDAITFFVFIIVFVFAVNRGYSKYEINLLITVYIAISLICSIIIIYNWATRNYYNTYFHRASLYFWGVYKDPNYVMSYISPGSLFVLLRTIKANKIKKRVGYLFIFAIMVVSYVAVASRSAILSLLFSIIVYTFLSIINTKRFGKKMIIFIIVLIVMGLIGYILIKYLPQQAVSRLLAFNEDTRILIWKNALDVFKTHPILGDGMRAASLWTRQTNMRDTHNVYIDILCNFGVVGMLIFSVFFYKNFCRFFKSDRLIIIPSIISFMVPMFFINGFNTATFYLPLIFMGIFSNYSLIKKDLYQII